MFRQMFLVSKQTYNQYIADSGNSAPLQINHTQVENGGRVEIFNKKGCDDGGKPTQIMDPSPSHPLNVRPPINIPGSDSGGEGLNPEKGKTEIAPSPKQKSIPTPISKPPPPGPESAKPQPPDRRDPPEFVLPLPASLSAPPPPHPPPPPPHPSTYRSGSPQPKTKSQSFYPPNVKVLREPVRDMSDPNITSPEEMVELLPDMSPTSGKLDEVVVLMTDMVRQSRRDMTHFLNEAKDENLRYIQLCKESYAEIKRLMSDDVYGAELADKISGRVQAMMEPNFSNVQRSIELQKITAKQLESYMLSEQSRGNEIASIREGIVTDVTSAFAPIQSQLMQDARNFYTAEQNVWAERFNQFQNDIREMNAAQYRSLHQELESSRNQWRREVAQEQRLELEYQLNEWDRRSAQLSISQTTDVQRYINQARSEMNEAFRLLSQDFNNRQMGEHDRRFRDMQAFITNHILRLEQTMNRQLTGPGAQGALTAPPAQGALPAPPMQGALPAPPVQGALTGPPPQQALPAPPVIPAIAPPPPPPSQPPSPPPPPSPPRTPSPDISNIGPPQAHSTPIARGRRGSVEDEISRGAALNRRPTNNERKKIFKAAASTAEETRARTRERVREGRSLRRNAKRNAKRKRDENFVYSFSDDE